MAAAAPPKCAWLAGETLSLEARALEAERRGASAEAALHLKRAAAKCSEAAELAAEAKHPDTEALREHADGLQLRTIYLESLGGAPPTLPLEDHFEPLTLTMDLSIAEAPAEEAVPALLAAGGASGESAALDDDGLQLVRALGREEELRAFLARLLAADGRGLCSGPEPEARMASLVSRCATGEAASLADVRRELNSAAWVAPIIGKDKMEGAVALETQAKQLEAAGNLEGALRKYTDALQVFRYVIKFDDRAKNVKIKEMLSKRIEDLETCVAALTLKGIQ
eukprot:TRINITY_DN5336_c0_g1_i1.p1 TRINITY_DN5336_c0_g1~~TRINITY_DN5336_c0_g1_i1.p1  ORF type:complete len:282 (-),score=86.84 TRINITY_DN5336_c0_g1_i1:83-928(-)